MIYILFLPQCPFYLPDHAFIYGIAYDAFGFIIYSFFPRVVETNAHHIPTQWGYGCTKVDHRFESVFEDGNRRKRLRAIRALLVVQHHAAKLFDYFWEKQFQEQYPELLHCHKLWDQEGLWG